MTKSINPAYLLREARSRAGLTQRELAKRADTAQSVIARIELGKNNPTTATLNHLLASAGFELHSELVVRPIANSHMLEDVSRILQLTPEERLQEVKKTNEFLNSAEHV
jgi:predicted transcriptional regulator